MIISKNKLWQTRGTIYWSCVEREVQGNEIIENLVFLSLSLMQQVQCMPYSYHNRVKACHCFFGELIQFLGRVLYKTIYAHLDRVTRPPICQPIQWRQVHSGRSSVPGYQLGNGTAARNRCHQIKCTRCASMCPGTADPLDWAKHTLPIVLPDKRYFLVQKMHPENLQDAFL